MLTERQLQVLELMGREQPVSGPRVAGEFETRSQDAGRTLAALERKGLVRFRYWHRPAGWVLVPGDGRLLDGDPRRLI